MKPHVLELILTEVETRTRYAPEPVKVKRERVSTLEERATLDAALSQKELQIKADIARRESYRKRAAKAAATRKENQKRAMYKDRAIRAAATRKANKAAAELAIQKEKWRQRALKAAATRAANRPKRGRRRCWCNARGCNVGPFTGQIDYD